MEWNYKNIIITIQNDGCFYFNFKGNTDCSFTLNSAKEKIDKLTDKYYNFTEKNKDKLLSKLDSREVDFINSLINELNRHKNNVYCEIGISDEMLFNF